MIHLVSEKRGISITFMQSPDTQPAPSPLPFPRPKISLLDLKPAPDHITDLEARNKFVADQLGMTVTEMKAYLASLPRR